MGRTNKAESKVVEFPCPNVAAYDAFMDKVSSDNTRCWIGSVAFGQGYASSYPCPSAIPYTVCGDPPEMRRGYWRNGRLHKFPDRQQIKYENTGLCSD